MAGKPTGTARKAMRKPVKANGGQQTMPGRPELFAALDDTAAQRRRMAAETASLDALAPIDAVADLTGMMASHIELFRALVDETQERIEIARANNPQRRGAQPTPIMVDEPAGICGAVERFNFLAQQYNARIDAVWQTLVDTRIGRDAATWGNFTAETFTEIVATIFFDRLGLPLNIHSIQAGCAKDEGVARILYRHKFSPDPAAISRHWLYVCEMLGSGAPRELPASLADLIPQLKVEFRAAALAAGKSPDRPAVDATGEVAWFLGGGRYNVGTEIIVLEDAEADALQLLVNLQAATKKQLSQSGAANPARSLRAICNKYPTTLARFIVLPGARNRGGYRTTIQRRES